MTVLLGSDRLLESGLVAGQRVGVVSNPASVDRHLRHTADRIAGCTDVVLAALFGPSTPWRTAFARRPATACA
jgi:uncharacterized protein YbbC (DUF1343 family)